MLTLRHYAGGVQRSENVSLAAASLEHGNRDFFDVFLTRLVKARFHAAASQSATLQMTILVNACTSARCELRANSCTLIVAAARIASCTPELIVVLLAGRGSARAPLCRTLRYHAGRGWLDTRRGRGVGRLTDWTDMLIACFLRWACSDGLA